MRTQTRTSTHPKKQIKQIIKHTIKQCKTLKTNEITLKTKQKHSNS